MRFDAIYMSWIILVFVQCRVKVGTYYIYINIHNCIAWKILNFRIWKCAQIDQHPSIMLVPNYQIPKRSLKFWWKIFKVPENAPDLFIAFPHPGDWQDDVRSSLYIHFWCSCIWTTSLVVWSPQMTRQTWVRFLAGSIFWNFEFRFLWHFHMFRGIYRHIWTEIITTTVV